ncbi:MAG: PIN domain-containing protein [Acidobacteriaceae bacterium]|nr:PIN domain-containing protein [Acidobacteriaceae bacterium]
MPDNLCLIDSNILIRWVQPADPDYAIVVAALSVLVKSGAVLCYTSQNLAEFWNALTRPASRNGFGLPPEEADRRARRFESQLLLLADGMAVHEEWRKLLADYCVSGVQVHDTRLVAAMRVHGVKRILTFNTRDFARFVGIEAVHPQEVVRQNV